MNSKPLIISIWIFVSACLHVAHNHDYRNIEVIAMSCPNKDRCATQNSTMVFSDRNCECDSLCHIYDDCCIDARRPLKTGIREIFNYTCLRFGGHLNTGVYVINTCPHNWSGPEIVRQMCQGNVDFSDPLNAAPVISKNMKITYRNRYCAECNDASPSSLTSFQILVSCDGVMQLNMSDYNWNIIEYDSKRGVWGMKRWNSILGRNEFLACEVLFDLPEYAKDRVRMCRANLISNCHSRWMRHQVRRACESYMAVVYGNNNRVYKNPHCALCNDISVESFTCNQDDLSKKKKPLSFVLFLDVNPGDGDQVNTSSQATRYCQSTQIYDPFFKRCRNLECAALDHRMVKGRCRQGTPSCPSGHIYVPFLKMCRKYSCSIAGHKMVEGKCVPPEHLCPVGKRYDRRSKKCRTVVRKRPGIGQ